MTQFQGPPGDGAAIDGRRQRTVDSRARIISAMVELTEAGHVGASAELVAERARVGLRTVFRHFKDMDSLYREMSQTVERRLRDETSFAFVSTDWRGRLDELIRRRATVFEKLSPFKRAEAAYRHRSVGIGQDISRANALFRGVLRDVVRGAVADDGLLFETLDMLLSYDTWERLRREQGLSEARAREVLETTIARILPPPE